MGLRDAIKSLSPTWLQTGNGEKFLYLIGLGADLVLEKLNQGMRLHMPGYGDASALPLIGNDRLISRGITETAAQYAARLKLWLDDWQRAGGAFSVLQQVLGLLSNYAPTVRTVNDMGVWDSYAAGSNASATPPWHYSTFGGSNWLWDNESYDPTPPGGNAWWRWWLVVFAGTTVAGSVTAATNATPIQITCASHGLATGAQVVITGVGGNTAANGNVFANGPWTITKVDANNFTLNGSAGNGAYTSGGTVYGVTPSTWAIPEGSWGDGQTYTDGGVWGFELAPGVYVANPLAPTTLNFVQTLRNIVALWKAGASWCRWTILSFDTSLFDPFQPADNVHNPLAASGNFAHWGATLGTNYQPVRFANARYIDGTT